MSKINITPSMIAKSVRLIQLEELQMSICLGMIRFEQEMRGEDPNVNLVMEEQALNSNMMNMLMNEDQEQNGNLLMDGQAPLNMMNMQQQMNENQYMMNMLMNDDQTENLNLMEQQQQSMFYDQLIAPVTTTTEEPNPVHMNISNYIEAAAGIGCRENNINISGNENHHLAAVEAALGHEDQEAGEDDDDDDDDETNRMKKTYHRHTPSQIKEMEKFFKHCPRPDEKQRRMLSLHLGMELMQVKFWFQNKRTQSKAHQERHENSQLREENEQLKTDNLRYKSIIEKSLCPKCGEPSSMHAAGEISLENEQRLLAENERIRGEVSRIRRVARVSNIASGSRNTGTRPNNNNSSYMVQGQSSRMGQGGSMSGASNMMMMNRRPQQQQPQQQQPQRALLPGDQIERRVIWQMAEFSLEEVVKMAEMGEPLWIPNKADSGSGIGFKLNEEEYIRAFPIGFGPRPETFYTESSRHTATLSITPNSLLEIFLSPTHWKSFFDGIVSKVSGLEVLSSGAAPGNYDGALHVMSMETHALTPFVPWRDNILARHCKKVGEKKWAVADVSLDVFRSFHEVKSRKRPSGCVIEDIGNGHTKVTWIEHVEAEELPAGLHPMYRPLVTSGLAFGAKRWLGILRSQTDRLVSVVSSTLPIANPVEMRMQSKRSHTRLSERMVGVFNLGLCTMSNHPWTTVPYNGPNQIRILMLRNSDNPGRPQGVILTATYSFWLNVPPITIFQYLLNNQTRGQWDILTPAGAQIEEISRLGIGRDPDSSILVQRHSETMLILQEAVWDPMGSYIVYAPVDSTTVNLALVGGESDYITILPSGFVIVPDGLGNESDGSLVTLSVQQLVDPNPHAEVQQHSIETLTNTLNSTMDSLKLALMNDPEVYFT